MQLADLRHRIDDRTALGRALQEVLGPDRVFTHPTDLIAYEYGGSVLTASVINLDITKAVAAGGYFYQVVDIAHRYGIRVANVFHAGDGNLHPPIPYDASNAEETGRILKASEEMLAACIAAGETLSEEHGIGVEKNNYMPWIFSASDLDAQRRLKTAFDPDDLMNPFKVFPTPVSCGELLARHAPRLATSGLWI